MPPVTIKGILDAVLDLGLKPVFVDIDSDTLCFDSEKLNSAITDKTKAIIITYLFGMVPDVEKMVSDCRAHDLFIIEDFSQCLNGKFKNRKVGSFGDVGVYSASSIKTLDTYGGGLLVCDDSSINETLKTEQNKLSPPVRGHLIKKIITDLVRNIATSRIVFHIIVFPLIRLLNYFKPDMLVKQTGDRDKNMISSLPSAWFTWYTSFQAMIGLELLDKTDIGDRKRLANVKEIKSNVNTLSFPSGVENGENVYWQLVAYFEKPDKVRRYLHSKKVDTATTSLEKISSLPAYPYQGKTPNADRLYTNALFIPCYPNIKDTDIKYLCDVLSNIPKDSL
jgi:dTDP-4-amino-4,6-dideoxygalactose transaminase